MIFRELIINVLCSHFFEFKLLIDIFNKIQINLSMSLNKHNNNPMKNSFYKVCTSSVMCNVPSHHALASDSYNFSLATVPDPEWLVHSALCMTDSSKQANTASSWVFFCERKFSSDYSNALIFP